MSIQIRVSILDRVLIKCCPCRYGLRNAAPVHKFSIAQEKMPRKIVDAVMSQTSPVSVEEAQSKRK